MESLLAGSSLGHTPRPRAHGSPPLHVGGGPQPVILGETEGGPRTYLPSWCRWSRASTVQPAPLLSCHLQVPGTFLGV